MEAFQRSDMYTDDGGQDDDEFDDSDGQTDEHKEVLGNRVVTQSIGTGVSSKRLQIAGRNVRRDSKFLRQDSALCSEVMSPASMERATWRGSAAFGGRPQPDPGGGVRGGLGGRDCSHGAWQGIHQVV